MQISNIKYNPNESADQNAGIFDSTTWVSYFMSKMCSYTERTIHRGRRLRVESAVVPIRKENLQSTFERRLRVSALDEHFGQVSDNN